MSRMLLTFVLAGLMAAPAIAQEIRVPVAGKGDAALRAEVRRAVETVCKAADREGAFKGAYRLQNCLMDSEGRAMAQARVLRRSTELAHSSGAGATR